MSLLIVYKDHHRLLAPNCQLFNAALQIETPIKTSSPCWAYPELPHLMPAAPQRDSHRSAFVGKPFGTTASVMLCVLVVQLCLPPRWGDACTVDGASAPVHLPSRRDSKS